MTFKGKINCNKYIYFHKTPMWEVQVYGKVSLKKKVQYKTYSVKIAILQKVINFREFLTNL